MLRTIRIALICFLLICIVSCGSKKEQEETIQLIWWGDIYNRAFATKLVETYNKRNPVIKISLITPQDYWVKLQTMLAGGTAPDVFLLVNPWTYELADKEVLLPLDDYKKEPTFNAFQNSVWESLKDGFSYEGHLYAIPIWTCSVGIFYNKGLFDKAGLEYPSKDWDLEELLEKAKRLTIDADGDGRIDQFGFGGIPMRLEPIDIYMLIKAFGGELYSDDLKRCFINTPEAISAVKWAVELITKHHVSPSPSEVSSGYRVVSASGPDMFQMGKVAMVFWGRWYLDILSKGGANINWGIAPYPKGKEKVMFEDSAYLGISSKTKHPQECWEFIKFVISEEGQRMVALDRTDIPVLRNVAYSQDFLNYMGREDANKVFLEMLEYSETPAYILGTGSWEKSAEDKLTLVVLGKLGLEEACAQIAREFQNVVR